MKNFIVKPLIFSFVFLMVGGSLQADPVKEAQKKGSEAFRGFLGNIPNPLAGLKGAVPACSDIPANYQLLLVLAEQDSRRGRNASEAIALRKAATRMVAQAIQDQWTPVLSATTLDCSCEKEIGYDAFGNPLSSTVSHTFGQTPEAMGGNCVCDSMDWQYNELKIGDTKLGKSYIVNDYQIPEVKEMPTSTTESLAKFKELTAVPEKEKTLTDGFYSRLKQNLAEISDDQRARAVKDLIFQKMAVILGRGGRGVDALKEQCGLRYWMMPNTVNDENSNYTKFQTSMEVMTSSMNLQEIFSPENTYNDRFDALFKKRQDFGPEVEGYLDFFMDSCPKMAMEILLESEYQKMASEYDSQTNPPAMSAFLNAQDGSAGKKDYRGACGDFVDYVYDGGNYAVPSPPEE